MALKRNYPSISEVEKLVISGKYKEAIEIIDNVFNQKDLSNEERYSYLIWKSQIYNKTSIFTEAIRIAEETLKLAEKSDYYQLKLDALENKIENLWRTGQFSDSFQGLKLYKESIKLLLKKKTKVATKREAFYYFWLGLYYFIGINDFEKGEVNINRSIELYTKINDACALGRCKEVLGWLFLYKKDLEIARKYAEESLRIYDKIGNPRDLGWAYFLKGWIYYFSDKIDKAKEAVEKSLPFFESLEMQHNIAYLHNFLSFLYMNEGDFEKSIQHSEIGLKILEKTDIKPDLMFSIVTKSMAHFGKKDLDNALESMKKTLNLLTSASDKYEILMVLNDIGKIYHQKGDLNEAQKNYMDSLKIAKEIDEKITIANILFSLLTIGIELSHSEKIDSYLNQLRELNDLIDDFSIKQYTDIAESLVLKTSARAIKRGKAEAILKNKLEQKIDDTDLEITALVNLCEILLIDFPLSKDKEILIELTKYIEKLMSIAKKKNMFSIIVETYRLQSQLALAELNLKEARELLIQARTFAENKGLEKLAQDIITEQNNLEKQLEMWLEMIDRKATIFETIDHVSLEATLKNISKEKTLSGVEGRKGESLIFKKLFSIKM